jgi:hypothetical protein
MVHKILLFNLADEQTAGLVHEKHVEFATQYFRPNISEVLIQFFHDEDARD